MWGWVIALHYIIYQLLRVSGQLGECDSRETRGMKVRTLAAN
jgi:hypothetical protein